MRIVRVIPILVDGAQMPRTRELPPTLAALVRRQALELSPNQFTFDTNRLFKVLDKTLAEVRTAQKNTSSISTSDANPDGASNWRRREFRSSRRSYPSSAARHRSRTCSGDRRPDRFGYAEAALASLYKDMEPCWAGRRYRPNSAVNCSRRRHQFQLDHAFNASADETEGSQRRLPQRLGG
jgi:hypothetical protein